MPNVDQVINSENVTTSTPPPEVGTCDDNNDVTQFFTIHEDRDVNNNPELNTNGVNGYADEEADDVEIG